MFIFLSFILLTIITMAMFNCLIDYAYNRVEIYNELKIEQYSDYMRKARNRARKRRWRTKQSMKEKQE